MRLSLFLSIAVLTGGFTGSSCQQEGQSLSSLLSKNLYEKAFPHHHVIYTYAALIEAAASYPSFAGEGDLTQRKRELAAFFAHIGHETTNGADSTPYSYGLYYTQEQACLDGHCTQYNTGGNSSYEPAPGKSYYGRGPLQLTYAYNYGLAGEELNLPLLAKPELISQDGVIAFRTALWFWMKPQKPKPSCHEVLCGRWKPTAEDDRLGRKPGFGMTINIINGGIECSTSKAEAKDERQDRIGFYKHMAALLQTTVENDCDCANMSPYTPGP